MSVHAIKKEEYHRYKSKFLAWARRQWPVFAEADYEDVYHEALMKYLVNAREGKIRQDLDPLMLIRGFGQDNFRKRWRALRKSWQKVIPMDQISSDPEEQHSFENNADDDPADAGASSKQPFSSHPEEEEYVDHISKAKEAFELLSEEEKDLLSAKVIHNIAWKDFLSEMKETEGQGTPGSTEEEDIRFNQRLRKRKESAVKKLRKHFYNLLDQQSEAAKEKNI